MLSPHPPSSKLDYHSISPRRFLHCCLPWIFDEHISVSRTILRTEDAQLNYNTIVWPLPVLSAPSGTWSHCCLRKPQWFPQILDQNPRLLPSCSLPGMLFTQQAYVITQTSCHFFPEVSVSQPPLDSLLLHPLWIALLQNMQFLLEQCDVWLE